MSIAEAVASGKPTVISFATPAFCVSATCGPQVSDISELAREYQGRANFVHVEVYLDPHLIDPANPSRQLAPAVGEWGLVSEPWTFVVGNDGRIDARFEQYVPPSVLEPALLSALHP
jgi:peroxiredoxin